MTTHKTSPSENEPIELTKEVDPCPLSESLPIPFPSEPPNIPALEHGMDTPVISPTPLVPAPLQHQRTALAAWQAVIYDGHKAEVLPRVL